MTPVKTQPRYKCDYCKRRSTKAAMILHEKRCYRNPNRVCDNCENKGHTLEPRSIEGELIMAKIDCEYCARFDKEQLKAIQEYEKIP